MRRGGTGSKAARATPPHGASWFHKINISIGLSYNLVAETAAMAPSPETTAPLPDRESTGRSSTSS